MPTQNVVPIIPGGHESDPSMAQRLTKSLAQV